MKLLQVALGVVLIVPFFLTMGSCTYNNIRFDIDCAGHLKRAAEANSVELAIEELETVVSYIESHKLTDGSTAVFWHAPSTDIKFWYRNVTSALQELHKVQPETTALERTNILLKLRETLTDQGESGLRVSTPQNIAQYPFQAVMAWSLMISGVVAVGGVILVCIGAGKLLGL